MKINKKELIEGMIIEAFNYNGDDAGLREALGFVCDEEEEKKLLENWMIDNYDNVITKIYNPLIEKMDSLIIKMIEEEEI